MTKVVPKSPNSVQAASAAVAAPREPTPEEVAERQERIDYLKGLRGAGDQKEKRSRKWVILAIVLLALLIAGLGGAYWLLNKKPAAKQQTASTQQPVEDSTPDETPAATDQAADLKEYSSTNFSLGLSYPGDWKISDTANALTFTSPAQTLSGADGQDVSGAVVVTIRHQQNSLPEFKDGNAVAVLDSKNVAYTAPATGQRGNTYLSFLQYAATTIKGTLDAVYITGNSGYKKLQTIPQSDVVKIDPLVTVRFVECDAGKACSPTSDAVGVNADSWAASESYKTIETMLKSLSIE
jgi:cytoskeletal protein RodZ